MLCPSPDPRDSGKGRLSRIVPLPPSSPWPGMQHTLQDYCKTRPASNPFSSCLTLVLTAGSCVRPGVRLASCNTRAGRRLQPLQLITVCMRHGKTQAAPHLHISRPVRLEAPSFCQQHRCPAGTATILRAGEMPDLCQTDTRSLGDRGPNSDHPYGFPGLLLGCHMKGTLQGKSGCVWHISHTAVTLYTPLPPATESIQLTGPSHTMTSPAATPCLSRPHCGDHQATSACITLTLQKDFLSKAEVA